MFCLCCDPLPGLIFFSSSEPDIFKPCAKPQEPKELFPRCRSIMFFRFPVSVWRNTKADDSIRMTISKNHGVQPTDTRASFTFQISSFLKGSHLLLICKAIKCKTSEIKTVQLCFVSRGRSKIGRSCTRIHLSPLSLSFASPTVSVYWRHTLWRQRGQTVLLETEQTKAIGVGWLERLSQVSYPVHTSIECVTEWALHLMFVKVWGHPTHCTYPKAN